MLLGMVVLSGFFLKNIALAREIDEAGEYTNYVPQQTSNDIIPNYPSEVLTGEKVIDLSDQSLTVGGIFSKILPYIYTIAGLILLFMLIAGGLGLMTAAGDPKKIEASQGRITMALVGFLIVFISYFVVQLVEIMLNIQIL